MSGHSKWKNIMHKKEKTDAQKAKIFTKIGKEMAIAVKAGGPDPSTNSKLAQLIAKAKANVVQAIPELIEIATNISFQDNSDEKHKTDAKFGWYKFTSRFALPVYDSDGEIDRYNVFQVIMIVRHDEDEKMYLYDIMNIKKETSNLFQS